MIRLPHQNSLMNGHLQCPHLASPGFIELPATEVLTSINPAPPVCGMLDPLECRTQANGMSRCSVA